MTGAALLAVALAASPAHVALAGADRQAVRVTAARPSLAVDVSVAGYALDLRGRPRIVASRTDAAPWLTVRPRHLVVGRAGAVLTVTSAPPPNARAGDHEALVLLTGAVPSNGGVVVRTRIGIVVAVRVAGDVVHCVEVRGLRVRSAGDERVLELALANRGTVTEPLALAVVLLRRGRVLAQLKPEPRDLLPHSRGIVELPYAGATRGSVTARIELERPGGRRLVRTFPLKL